MNTTKNIQVPDNAWNFLLAENLLASQDSLCYMEFSALNVTLLLYQAFVYECTCNCLPRPFENH